MVTMACETKQRRCGMPCFSGCHIVGRSPRRCHCRPAGGPGRQDVVGRYYDPVTGQFLSVDPKVQQTLQAFLYAGDDPVDTNDPSGLFNVGFADRCGSLLSCHVTLKTQVGGSSLIGHLVGAVINFTGKAVVGTVIVLSTIPSDVSGAVSSSMNYVVGRFFGQYMPGPSNANLNFQDPAVSPGKGWEWRPFGSAPGSVQGAWYNPATAESLHPDFSNTAHEIHYDYNYRGSGCAGWRIYQNGRIEPKG